MLLTELKEEVDEALKLHDDYEVKVVGEDNERVDIADSGILEGRHAFGIHVDRVVHDEDVYDGWECYHIDEDTSIEHCEKCGQYFPSDEECPACRLNILKHDIDKLVS